MSKIVTLADLKEHNKKDSCWLLISGKVYDCTKFLDEHPGGDEVILAECGKDGTEAFEDVGHSDEARALLPDMVVGVFDKTSSDWKTRGQSKPNDNLPDQSLRLAVERGSHIMTILPLALLGGYFAWRYYNGA